jgi:hypothetical protein
VMGTSWHPGPRLSEPNVRDRRHCRNPGDDFRPDSAATASRQACAGEVPAGKNFTFITASPARPPARAEPISAVARFVA